MSATSTVLGVVAGEFKLEIPEDEQKAPDQKQEQSVNWQGHKISALASHFGLMFLVGGALSFVAGLYLVMSFVITGGGIGMGIGGVSLAWQERRLNRAIGRVENAAGRLETLHKTALNELKIEQEKREAADKARIDADQKRVNADVARIEADRRRKETDKLHESELERVGNEHEADMQCITKEHAAERERLEKTKRELEEAFQSEQATRKEAMTQLDQVSDFLQTSVKDLLEKKGQFANITQALSATTLSLELLNSQLIAQEKKLTYANEQNTALTEQHRALIEEQRAAQGKLEELRNQLIDLIKAAKDPKIEPKDVQERLLVLSLTNHWRQRAASSSAAADD